MAKYVDIDAVKEAVRGAECDANWDGRRFDAETSGAALCAILSSLLKAVGISLLKNTARIAAQRWTRKNKAREEGTVISGIAS